MEKFSKQFFKCIGRRKKRCMFLISRMSCRKVTYKMMKFTTFIINYQEQNEQVYFYFFMERNF